jgi:hypothetical protein
LNIDEMFDDWAKDQGFDTGKWEHPAEGYPYYETQVNQMLKAYLAGFKQAQKMPVTKEG